VLKYLTSSHVLLVRKDEMRSKLPSLNIISTRVFDSILEQMKILTSVSFVDQDVPRQSAIEEDESTPSHSPLDVGGLGRLYMKLDTAWDSIMNRTDQIVTSLLLLTGITSNKDWHSHSTSNQLKESTLLGHHMT